jgi:plastocyanin
MVGMMMRILRFVPGLVAIALVGVMSIGAMPTRATPIAPRQMGPAKTWQVSIKHAFIPSTLTISYGDSVTWRNTDTTDHTVSAINKTFASPTIKPGQTWTWTFNQFRGPQDYEDTIQNRLRGTITVQ